MHRATTTAINICKANGQPFLLGNRVLHYQELVRQAAVNTCLSFLHHFRFKRKKTLEAVIHLMYIGHITDTFTAVIHGVVNRIFYKYSFINITKFKLS